MSSKRSERLPITRGDDPSPRTERGNMVFKVEEFRRFIPDLITQDGSTIVSASEAAGYLHTGSYYQAMRQEGLSGMKVFTKMLEAIGYKVEFYVRVKNLRTETKMRLLDPSVRRNVHNMRRRRRRLMNSRFSYGENQ